METIEEEQLVSASFEACAAFAAHGNGSPVCAGCGWLEHEHDRERAEVRALRSRKALPRKALAKTPKRLAS